MLWVNAQNMLFLNKEAASIVEAFIKAMWEKGKDSSTFTPHEIEAFVVAEMRKIYRGVNPETLAKDFHYVYSVIEGVARGSCPIIDLKLGIQEVDPRSWTAPARMDFALTYRCNNRCPHCYADCPRATEELTTDQCREVIDLCWAVGIPQMVFDGGEATLRHDLVELVSYAAKFITGLVTNGRILGTTKLAEELFSASLDYVQISLESVSPQIHDHMVGVEGAWQETVEGILRSKKAGLQVTTNTTLTKENIGQFLETIRFCKNLGLSSVACNGLICSGRGSCAKKTNGLTDQEVRDVLIKAKDLAGVLGIELQWYTPSCYKRLNPMELGFGVKHCSAAQYNMMVEPDGRVIPCQSWIHQKLGNILEDSWSSIWGNPIAVALRNGDYGKNDECRNCQYLPTCGGGCPLERLEVGK